MLPIDNEPDCFWGRAADVARRELPELAEMMAKTKFPATLGRYCAVLKEFSNILLQNNEILLVYDNAEKISNETVLLFIDSLIKAKLESSALYISAMIARNWDTSPATAIICRLVRLNYSSISRKPCSFLKNTIAPWAKPNAPNCLT